MKRILLLFLALSACADNSYCSNYKISQATAYRSFYSSLILYITYKLFYKKPLPPITPQMINVFTCALHTAHTRTRLKKIPLYSLSQVLQKLSKQDLADSFFITMKQGSAVQKSKLFVQKGVLVRKQYPYIGIHCRGYARPSIPLFCTAIRRGSGLLALYRYVNDQYISVPCITYDTISESSFANFAQDIDQSCLHLIHKEILAQAPEAKIVLSGACLGAYNILRFLQTSPKNVHAVVLISPVFSVERILRNLCQHYAGLFQRITGISLLPVTYFLFNRLFKRFDRQKDTLENELHLIKGQKIFIVHCLNDQFIHLDDMTLLVDRLAENNDVKYIFTKDPRARHANFSDVPFIRKRLHQFYKYCGLPYDLVLAYT